ncbi:MAG TPA: hypothetical protein VGB03_09555 [Acidimicrobiales bacterium]|jgi:hypothetical protein
MDGCGGWLITHEDGTVECVDADCEATDPVLHDWRIPCADLDQPCHDCAEPLPQRQSIAA